MTLVDLADAILGERDLGPADEVLLPTLVELALLARRAGFTPGLEDLADPLERRAWLDSAAILAGTPRAPTDDERDLAALATATDRLAVRWAAEARGG